MSELAKRTMSGGKWPGAESYWSGSYGSASITINPTKQYELIAAYFNANSYLFESALFTVKNGTIAKIGQTTNRNASDEYYITATKDSDTSIRISTKGGAANSFISACLIEKG